MQYLAWRDRFTKIAEGKGVIQNTSRAAVLEVSDSQTPDSGILLQSMEKLPFEGDIYVRCANGGSGVGVRVATFVTTGNGGGSSSSSNDNLATDEQIAELNNRIFPLP